MNQSVRARREQLWKRYVLFGEPRDQVVAELADDYGVADETVADDIQTMTEWLPELDVRRRVSGISLVAELRQNRQRLHQLAQDASDEGDITAERKIREEINRSLDLERRLNEASMKIEKPLDRDERIDDMLY